MKCLVKLMIVLLLALNVYAQEGRPHQYVTESIWNGCGGIPYAGWEGWTSQMGILLKSDDGATVYFVQDRYTSPGAAKGELLSRLKGAKGEGPQWQIIQTTPVDNVLLVELAAPVPVAPDGPALSKWVYVWVEDGSLNMIYGPDREHVDEYFKIRQKDQRTRPGKNGS